MAESKIQHFTGQIEAKALCSPGADGQGTHLGPKFCTDTKQTSVTARKGEENSPTQSLAAVMRGGDGGTVMLRKPSTQGSGSQDLPKIGDGSGEVRNPPTTHPIPIPHPQLYWPHHMTST